MMTDRKSIEHSLLSIVLMSCFMLSQVSFKFAQAVGFDLNELPSDELMEPTTDTTGSRSTELIHKALRLRKHQMKVAQLFDIVKICNSTNFDINKLDVPHDWEKHRSALMALNKLAASNLIAKSDLPKYKRVMKNCAELSAKEQRRAEKLFNIESQAVSGEDYSDKYRRMMETSPLENLRGRFNQPLDKRRLESEFILENHGVVASSPERDRKTAEEVQQHSFGIIPTSDYETQHRNPETHKLINFI